MGSRGPISKRNMPAALRIVGLEDEHPKHPRVDTAADKVALARPAVPPELNGDLADLYQATAEQLDEAGLASNLDAMALALAVTHYGAAMEAARSLDSEGPVIPGAMGGVIANPAAGILKGQSAAFHDLAKGLGLTFGARARIVVPKEGQDSLDAGNPFGAGTVQRGQTGA